MVIIHTKQKELQNTVLKYANGCVPISQEHFSVMFQLLMHAAVDVGP
jgi:hypothetical protein